MNIIKTDDLRYPIMFDDGWGCCVDDGAFLDVDTVMDDKLWHNFIKELNKIREEIKKERM